MTSTSRRLLRPAAAALLGLLLAQPCAGQGDLVIQDYPGDTGRPHNYRRWWSCPDINPTEVVGGRDNAITVRCRNRGNRAISEAHVDLYYTYAGTNLPPYVSLLKPAEDINPQGVAGRTIYCGRDTLRNVAPGQEAVARFTLRPPRSGHMCLLAIIRSPEDPFSYTESTLRRLVVSRNNNCAQRNYGEVTYDPEPEPPPPGPQVLPPQVLPPPVPQVLPPPVPQVLPPPVLPPPVPQVLPPPVLPPPGPQVLPPPRRACISFLVANQDPCQAKRAELLVDATGVPPGAQVALVLPGLLSAVNTYNLRSGTVALSQLCPADPSQVTTTTTTTTELRTAVVEERVTCFYLIPGTIARITDILLLAGHGIPAQVVVTERPPIGRGASFEIHVEQLENGCIQGGMGIAVRLAR